jgi:hypothetical protein
VPNHAEFGQHVEDLRNRDGSTWRLPHLGLRDRSLGADDSTRTRFCPGQLRPMPCDRPVGRKSVTEAPPFRNLHVRYPVEDLEESLAEGIRTGHPAMPEFALDKHQIRNLISYLKSLER